MNDASSARLAVGSIVRLRAEPVETHVVATGPYLVSVAWPWRAPDPSSPRPFPGKCDFPADPAVSYLWRSTPWRLDPEPSELAVGSPCIVGIPPTDARILTIGPFDPDSEYGFVPTPDQVVGAVDLAFEDDDEAGFTLYIGSDEPVEIDVIG